MRSKPPSAEARIETALAALAVALDEAGAPWMVIGGIAAIARGVRRMTTDIDAVVRGDRVAVPKLLRVLARHDIVPRVDQIEAFARASLVLLLRHAPTGVGFDVSFGWTAFEQEALELCSAGKFGAVSAPMARPEDLVIYKAMAARPTDIQDVTTLLAMHADIDLARVRRRLGELAELVDEPSLMRGLETMIATANASRPAKRPPAKPRAKATKATRAKPRR